MKWEYKTLIWSPEKYSLSQIADSLNEEGKEGWEVCGLAQETEGWYGNVILKRPLTQE